MIVLLIWWEKVHHLTNLSIIKWGPTSSLGSSMYHHVKNKFINVSCPNWWAYWWGLTSSYGVSGVYTMKTFLPSEYFLGVFLATNNQLTSLRHCRGQDSQGHQILRDLTNTFLCFPFVLQSDMRDMRDSQSGTSIFVPVFRRYSNSRDPSSHGRDKR